MGCSADCLSVLPLWECSGGNSSAIDKCFLTYVADPIVKACDDNNEVSGDGCSSTFQIEQGYTCTGNPSNCTSSCGNG